MHWYFSQQSESPTERALANAISTSERAMIPGVGELSDDELRLLQELSQNIPEVLREHPVAVLTSLFEELFWRGGALHRIAEYLATKESTPWLKPILPPQDCHVSGLLFSPDSRLLFVSRWSKPALLWSFPELTSRETKLVETQITPGSGQFDGYMFSEDSRYLSAAGVDYAGMTDVNEYDFVYDLVADRLVRYADRYRSEDFGYTPTQFVKGIAPRRVYSSEGPLLKIKLATRSIPLWIQNNPYAGTEIAVSADERWVAVGGEQLHLYQVTQSQH